MSSIIRRLERLETAIVRRRIGVSEPFWHDELECMVQEIGRGLIVPLAMAADDWERRVGEHQAELMKLEAERQRGRFG